MKIGEILTGIDLGFIALPMFQRGYVWNREQVRQLFTSLYRSYPVGGLLFWATKSDSVTVKGEIAPAVSPVRLLLDGQQRVTSLYGVMRGQTPSFFEGNADAFTGLRFHMDEESFEFYQPVKMQNDPLWVDVSAVMMANEDDVGQFAAPAASEMAILMRYMTRLGRLRGIRDREMYDDEISGEDKTIEVVVDIFNRVNSGGTKLSTGDLALARICANWPEARDEMNAQLRRWADAGFERFDLDWLLRSVTTVLTGEARFVHLEGRSTGEVQDALKRAVSALDRALNLISDRLGLDHGRVLFSRNAFPVMANFIDRHGGSLTNSEENLLLYWYIAGGLRGRFSGSTETAMDQDLAAIAAPDGSLERLVDQLDLWAGSTEILPSHFDAATSNSRFYPVLYLLTRMDEARDFCSGLELKRHLFGKQSHLEVHHIFPKSQLYKHGYDKRQVNALANFCFLTAQSNKKIGNKLPATYFPACEGDHPGVLSSQWIPASGETWTLDRYPEFLARRRVLLADAANAVLDSLRSGTATSRGLDSAGHIEWADDDDEERELRDLMKWATEHALNGGELGCEIVTSGETDFPLVLDLAWVGGVQAELSEPVAVLLNEPPSVLEAANAAGFRCFTSVDAFKRYVEIEIFFEGEDAA